MAILFTVIKSLVLLIVVLTIVAYVTLLERRLLARFQHRIGPNRVGPWGLLQPAADALKSIFKEELTVGKADRFVYIMAPMISMATAFLMVAVIPFGPSGSFFGLDPWVSDLDLGILYIFAVSEIAVYGVFLAGWASANKYSLLGGLRSAAGLISYELGLGISLLGPILLVGSLNLNEIVAWQAAHPVGLWLYQLPALIIFLIASLAEASRTPFDLPEAEQELIGGYHTEYSGMKFTAFYIAEYGHLTAASLLIPTLFFGGWHAPFGLPEIPYLWLFVKMAIFLSLFIWIRATLLRIRYDQLMRFSWGTLFPVALLWFLVTAFYVVLQGGVA